MTDQRWSERRVFFCGVAVGILLTITVVLYAGLVARIAR